jgi:hypothetical protein
LPASNSSAVTSNAWLSRNSERGPANTNVIEESVPGVTVATYLEATEVLEVSGRADCRKVAGVPENPRGNDVNLDKALLNSKCEPLRLFGEIVLRVQHQLLSA